MPRPEPLPEREVTLHGHRVSYRAGGSGPVVVLVHGIAGSARTWDPILPSLARGATVVAPDLLGHGASAKPRGDYSLGAFASGLRDLLAVLGHDRVTMVGHSLGGGIAMQFAYQFPERLERLVLVASGGLGRDVHLVLRSAVLPGAEVVLPLLAADRVLRAGAAVGSALRRVGLRGSADLEEVARSFASLHDRETRAAFIHTVRALLDVGGQRIDASDRLYLARAIPTLLLWGERDPIIPVAHGREAHARMPGSRLEVFADAGHFPHRDDPVAFVAVLEDFLGGTEPGEVDPDELRALMLAAGREAL